MYIEIDLVTPRLMGLMNDRKFKNRILKWWPMENSGGVLVLGKLYLYIRGSGVQNTTRHQKIYQLLNIEVADLQREKWKSVENYWIEFKPTSEGFNDATNGDIYHYITTRTPIAEEAPASEWKLINLSYEPVRIGPLDNSLTDTQIIDKIKSDTGSLQYDHNDEENDIVPFMLLDKDDVLFEKELRITYKALVDTTNSRFLQSKDNKSKLIKSVNLTIRYRRKNKTEAEVGTYLTSVNNLFKSWTSTGTILLNNRLIDHRIATNVSSMVSHLKSIYNEMIPLADSNLIHSGKYKKSGLQDLPAKDFKKIVVDLKTGYKEQKVDAWKKFLATLVVVVIVVVATVATGGTGGITAAKGGAAMLTAMGVFAGKMALALSIGMLAAMGLARVVALSGDPAFAAYIGKSIQVIGTVAKIFGIVSLVIGIGALYNKIREIALEKAREQAVNAAVAGTQDVLTEFARDQVAAQITEVSFSEMLSASATYLASTVSTTTAEMLNTMLTWASAGFELYQKHINPANAGVQELQNELDAQNKQMEDMTGPRMKDKIDYMFSSPYRNIYDTNEYIQQIPYEMTQGRIDNATTKYYD